MLRIGIIGAGVISRSHLTAAKSVPDAEIVKICDRNLEQAKLRAEEFGVSDYCSDHKEILNDPTIDAVIVATPLFTHASLVKEALLSGKHVLCEKPPMMTWQEAKENEELAKKVGKLLTYGFVVRFRAVSRFIKDAVDADTLGNIYYAELSSVMQCNNIAGWFRDKERAGGGALIDGAIHQLDLLLYMMGYPKVKSVRGFTTYVNSDLPDRVKGLKNFYSAVNAEKIPRTIESFASGYVTFEGGKHLFIKTGHIVNSSAPDGYELVGDKGGIRVDGEGVKLTTIDETGYLMESKPTITDDTYIFQLQLQHFTDACAGKVPCLCPAEHGTRIMQIINAIYESAETDKEILFD